MAGERILEWFKSPIYKQNRNHRLKNVVAVQASARRHLAMAEAERRRTRLRERAEELTSGMVAQTMAVLNSAHEVVSENYLHSRVNLATKTARYELQTFAHASALALPAEQAPRALALDRRCTELEVEARQAQREIANAAPAAALSSARCLSHQLSHRALGP